jgi:crotonobetainyl-CoA:carnitine CoA-transferase CaiB-like acyl-CoA transferase
MPARISAWAIYDVFETRDLPVFIGVVSDTLWEKFCALLGFDELWADESLRANNQRVLARDRILPAVRDKVAGFTRAEIIARLEGTGIPFAPVSKPEELFDDPQLAQGGLETVFLDDGRETKLPTVPLEMAGRRTGGENHLPLPGRDARDVLAALGYGDEKIEELIGTGAVGAL